MTGSAGLRARWDAAMMPNYGTPPMAVDYGQGVRLWDADGREYLDFVGGIAVSALGHAHPAVVAAVQAQVGRLAHASNLLIHEPGVRLAERLLELTGGDGRVFFANSGAEANECALKIIRKHSDRREIVAAHHSFHGRTLGTLAITGNAAKRTSFEPLPGPVTFVDYGNAEALWEAVTGQTAAVFLEPALGEGGVVPAPPGYLASARAACDAVGALLVIDEVQSGIGRTGQWFVSLSDGVRPDLLTLAKGLGGGLPIGACIGFGAAGRTLAAGEHGSTFGGNPIACAAALAVLDTIADEHLLDAVKRVGEYLADGLAGLTSPQIAEVRGAGLWRGVVLHAPAAATVEARARDGGLLVNAVKPDVLRLAPPLILTEADVDEALPILADAFEAADG
jgi:acetylornithine/N-succinyldiaminopimelate aminotransferase